MIRLLALLTIAAGTAWAQLAAYDRITAQLSEPEAARWKHFSTPYFSSNEKLLNRFYPQFENAGGVIVGVSFQQNLSLLVHAHPELSVILDYNPAVTEVLVPFFGALFNRCATRQAFVSTLLGVEVSPEETHRLLETDPPVIATIMERAVPVRRAARIAELKALMSGVIARLPEASPARRAAALNWVDTLTGEELLNGVFFADSTARYNVPAEAGWLSTEANYALVRRYWKENRIIGITGDISGSSVAKLAAYIRENKTLRKRQVTGLYLSNVGVSIEGHFPMSWFANMYVTLAGLPIAPLAPTLIAQGAWRLTGFAEPFERAKWAAETLRDVPTQTVSKLREAPLEIMIQRGQDALIPALKQNLAALHTTLDPAVLDAPFPSGLPTDPTLRTLAVTLYEAGVLKERPTPRP